MKKRITLVCVLLLVLVTLAACGDDNNKLNGKWAYVHDTETAILVLKSNGTAIYNNDKYSYTYDDSFITLKASDGKDLKLRYEFDGADMFLYQPTVYVYDSEEVPDGLPGVWKGKEVEGWEFEFTESGEFKEDGYFPGYYVDDPENSRAKLIYNDQFEDTMIYYSIEGNELTIEYPWRMVKMSAIKKTSAASK